MSTLDRNADDPVRIRRNWQKLSKLVGDATDVDAGGRMRFMGVWDSATQYEPNDVVLRTKTFGAEDEAVFVSLTTNTNSALPTDSTDSDDWSHLTYSLTDSDNTSVVVSLAHGGTGLNAYSRGDLIYAPATDQLTTLAFTNAASRYLTNQGAGSTVPAWSQVNLANGVFGTLAITFGGTGATTANAAFNNLVPSQTSNSGKALTTDGTDTHWTAVGSVTSVALTMPTAIFDVAGSPITGSGTLAVTLDSQTANTAFMGPTTGGAAAPTFRGFVTADFPDGVVTYAKIQNVSATDRILGRSSAGAGVVQEITCTSFGRDLIDDTSVANQRTTLGLGTIAIQNANAVAITGGTITGLTNLTVTSGTITANTPVSITQTWNSGGVAFRLLDCNITNTSSDSSSRYIVLKVGGVEKFSFDMTGGFSAVSVSIGAGGLAFATETTFINVSGANGVTGFFIDGTEAAEHLDIYVADSVVASWDLSGAMTNVGNIVLSAAGAGIKIKEGSNATMGIATLVAGTVTVNTNRVTANSRIFLTRQTVAGTLGSSVNVTARSAGTSFTITSQGSILETSTVAWMIVEPA